ncbi:MAG: Gfo/Idh/MocA family oxidoreductase [Victivallales bacterium]|nr:Gfo/Idh/MocA family oxidoreductase [Victivallales bacterium]
MNITRRDFLRGSALVLGAAAVPSAWAAVNDPSICRIGLIGMGVQCVKGHLNGLLHRRDVRVVAMCDPESIRLNKAKEIAENYYKQHPEKNPGPIATFEDFRDLLARPDIDAVLIATQTHWHPTMSVLAARAGKHIYCEKPMTLSIEEGHAIIEAVRANNVVFQLGSQQRSDDRFRLACELVRNGRIGKVKEIFINNVAGPSRECDLPAEPTPPTLNWDLWLGPAPWRPYNKVLCPLNNWASFPQWRQYRDYDGGGMTNWGAHHFDIAQWALGMDESGPIMVVPPKESKYKRLTYVYANGACVIHGGAKPAQAGLEIIGEKGRICVNRGYLYTEPEELMRTKWGAYDIRLYESRNHHDNFFDCIRKHKDCICTPEIGHHSSIVCHLGIICYRLNRTVRWDPVHEGFLNDREANQLMCKPHRYPWGV